MLLAVEGGSFFSASSSGFSKGFTFLLSRDKDDGDSPMRVAPCNHYQLLVDKDHHPFLQLDSFKNRVSRGCASFSCFSCGGGGASAGLETTTTPCPPPKVEPPVVSSSPPESVSAVDTTTTTPSCPVKVDSSLQHPVVPESVTVPEKGKDQDGNKSEYDNTSKEASFKLSLRSSLKRPPSVAESRSLEGIKEDETLSVDDVTIGEDTGRRKVQWPDACGSELTQVREFEPSEMGFSDEEWETGRQRTCSCVIM